MPALLTALDLLSEVRRLGLVEDPGRLRAFESARESADQLAARLVTEHVLTAFQAQRLAVGNGASLVFRQYVLLEPVGAGGMGEVFKARHRVLGRVDAVKMIRVGRFSDADTARRFRQEARLAARCSHPNLITVYDADEADGVPFIAMEFVPGTNLHRLVQRSGPLPVGAACECARQAALGLHHAHEQGFIHRDVKPANLLVAGGRVRVTDLGLARPVDARRSHTDDPAPTGSAVVLGTPDFIAPEQCVSTKVVDRRADIYALGCTLYYLLTGRPPFPGGTAAEKILRHLSERPTPIRNLCPDVPPPLAALLDELLAREPDGRPPTAAIVAERLGPYCAPESLPDEAPPPPVASDVDTGWAPSLIPTLSPEPVPVVGPVRARSNRRLLLLAVAGVGLVAAILLTTRPWWKAPTDDARALVPEPAPLPATPVHHSELLPRLWKVADRINTPNVAGYALVFSPRGEYLVHVSGDSSNPTRRAEVRLWRISNDELSHLPVWQATVPENARSAAFAPDGSVFAVGCGDLDTDRTGHITLWSPDSEIPRGTAEHPGGVLALAFAPGGKYLVSGGRDGRLRVWDVSDPSKPGPVAERAAHTGSVQALAFNRDSSRLASGSADGAVKVWSGALWGDSTALPAPPGRSVRGLAFLAGGTALVAGMERRESDGRGVLRFWDLNQPQAARELTTREQPLPILALAVAPDGRTVLASEVNPNNQALVRVIDGAAGKVESYLWDNKDNNYRFSNYARQYAVAVSPSGQRIATTGSDANISWWEPAPDVKPPPPQ
jgi:serine/threonine-protein kinase